MDLKMTIDGDLEIGPNGDFVVVDGDDKIAQEILFRLKTTLGDFPLDPKAGTDLERFIGEPNIVIVREEIELEVIRAIQERDFLISPSVDVAPVNQNEILILVEFKSINDRAKTVQIVATLDLRKGLVFARALTKTT
jgi:phage baseplate assembly protein W